MAKKDGTKLLEFIKTSASKAKGMMVVVLYEDDVEVCCIGVSVAERIGIAELIKAGALQGKRWKTPEEEIKRESYTA
ncbi:hypothetical protein DRO19_00795 [Candidatus Bathyarchaeota archaeon]|nr:MAG: hypothetical protein DRO19_00795 [Candidatus Bathyarchaeota archaeon]